MRQENQALAQNSESGRWTTALTEPGEAHGVAITSIEPDLIARAPRGVPADMRELRATRYGSPRD